MGQRLLYLNKWLSKEAASTSQLLNDILSILRDTHYSLGHKSGQNVTTTCPRLEGMQCIKPRVFGSSKIPPWVERGGWVRRLNREIIDNFLLRTKEDVIHNIHPRYYNPTAQRTNAFNAS